jgi:hypothetical protein
LPAPAVKCRTGSSIPGARLWVGRARRHRAEGPGGWTLVELEKIRRLKYRYLRCVDLKLWDEIADVFTEDATADYGTPSAGRPLNLKSRDEIVAFLRNSLGNGIITLHGAGQPAPSAKGRDCLRVQPGRACNARLVAQVCRRGDRAGPA